MKSTAVNFLFGLLRGKNESVVLESLLEVKFSDFKKNVKKKNYFGGNDEPLRKRVSV